MSPIQRTLLRPMTLAATILLAGALVGGGCSRNQDAASGSTAARTPVETVNRLIADLRGNDLVKYADHVLPPAVHRDLKVAWSEGRTTWPLTQLPLSEQLPGFIATLAAPDAETSILASFRRQFAGADRELQAAASTLGLFAAQYVEQSTDYSDLEREHYAQLIAALSGWGAKAPLSDPARAKKAIPQLVAAARLTGLGGANALRQAGMERSLTRLGPLLARFKTVLAVYGLDIDAALAGASVQLIEQTGDTARVALTYTLAGQPVDAQIALERRAGRWYLSDLIRHAEIQATLQPATSPAPVAGPSAARLH